MQLVSQDVDVKKPEMNLVEQDTDVETPEMNLVSPDMNSDHVKMNLAEQIDTGKPEMKVQGGEIIDSEYQSPGKQSLKSGKIEEAPRKKLSLSDKMNMLTNLDMEQIEKAPMEELVKIIGAMEEVISDARNQMKMNRIQTVTQTSALGNRKMTMKMPVIEQDDRSPFTSAKMVAVDDEARERAERAYAKAHEKKKKD